MHLNKITLETFKKFSFMILHFIFLLIKSIALTKIRKIISFFMARAYITLFYLCQLLLLKQFEILFKGFKAYKNYSNIIQSFFLKSIHYNIVYYFSCKFMNIFRNLILLTINTINDFFISHSIIDPITSYYNILHGVCNLKRCNVRFSNNNI